MHIPVAQLTGLHGETWLFPVSISLQQLGRAPLVWARVVFPSPPPAPQRLPGTELASELLADGASPLLSRAPEELRQ